MTTFDLQELIDSREADIVMWEEDLAKVRSELLRLPREMYQLEIAIAQARLRVMELKQKQEAF